MKCDHKRRVMLIVLKRKHQRRRLPRKRCLLQSSAEEDCLRMRMAIMSSMPMR